MPPSAPDFSEPLVAAAFRQLPENARHKALQVRYLIYQVAERDRQIGTIKETLKWQVPSYLTVAPKTGTTVRLSVSRTRPDHLAVSVHCQTTIVEHFRRDYPELVYDKNRSVLLPLSEAPPVSVLDDFIQRALRYHLP